MAKDFEVYAQDRIGELVDIKGFEDADDVAEQIRDLEDDFDPESWCPYYSQQDEVIADYEREFGDDAEDYLGEMTYKATEWQQAKTAYAYAIASVAASSYFATAKDEIADGVEQFASDFADVFAYDDVVRVAVNMRSVFGWAAHNRELADGTMIFESGQLDGVNGMERKIGTLWVSATFDPNAAKEEDETES